MVSSVSDNLTISTQPNGFDIFYPNDFPRARGEDPNLAYVCVYVSVSGSVCDSWGETEVIRWRSCSFVPIISPCCRRHTLEYACRVFYVFAFFDGVCAVHWLRWSFPVDERI